MAVKEIVNHPEKAVGAWKEMVTMVVTIMNGVATTTIRNAEHMIAGITAKTTGINTGPVMRMIERNQASSDGATKNAKAEGRSMRMVRIGVGTVIGNEGRRGAIRRKKTTTMTKTNMKGIAKEEGPNVPLMTAMKQGTTDTRGRIRANLGERNEVPLLRVVTATMVREDTTAMRSTRRKNEEWIATMTRVIVASTRSGMMMTTKGSGARSQSTVIVMTTMGGDGDAATIKKVTERKCEDDTRIRTIN